MPDSFNQVISILLRNLGSKKEIDQYLREFTNVDSTKFAVIKIGGGIIEDSLEELVSSLTFLRKVGLFPIVLHGAGPQLGRAFDEKKIPIQKVDGLRVTSPEHLPIVREVLQNTNFTLVDQLEENAVRARPITAGVFEASMIDGDRLGLVGEVVNVNRRPIEAAICNGQLPIVSCLGETTTGQIVNINADVAARQLALAVQPYKVIFLTPTGGLLDANENVIPAVNLAEDFDSLLLQPWVHGGMRLKLIEINRLLNDLPMTSSVSITSPQQLATELFTHRGSGTLIRRGESIDAFTSFGEIDKDQLRGLIESSFGKFLVPDYFETREVERIFVTRNYSAAAIITREGEHSYLDKFAVTERAQGTGLGASLWSRLVSEIPALFWRARSGNRVSPWYFQRSQGTHRTDEWVVFWYGLSSRNEIETCIKCARAKPPSLLESLEPSSINKEDKAVLHA